MVSNTITQLERKTNGKRGLYPVAQIGEGGVC